MEVDNVIIGSRLSEIKKKPDEVKLVFENSKTKKSYVLSFRGLLFETSGLTLNRRVMNIQINSTLGFRATSQLRHLNRNPHNYRQMFIQMEGSNDDNKLELLGAFRNYKISPKREAVIRNTSTATKKKVSKKK
jgi:hypothetical protein